MNSAPCCEGEFRNGGGCDRRNALDHGNVDRGGNGGFVDHVDTSGSVEESRERKKRWLWTAREGSGERANEEWDEFSWMRRGRAWNPIQNAWRCAPQWQ